MWCAAGYFDESADPNQAYAVAGFVGHQHDCVHLDWEWKERILHKYDLEYFKASELESGTGQFAKFRDSPDPKQLDTKFSSREKDLFTRIKTESIDIFLEFDLLTAFGAAVMLPDYHRLLDECQMIGRPLHAPYFYCAQLVMMESGFMMDALNKGAPPCQQGFVRPIFDKHEEYSGRAKQMLDDFTRKNPFCSKWLLPPHYEDDRDYVALQVADNLAYETRRLLITSEYDKHIPERRAMTRLKERFSRIYKLNYEALKALLEGQQPDTIPIKPEIENHSQRKKGK
jgi:hypothetical protein